MTEQELRDERRFKLKWQIACPTILWLDVAFLFWILVNDSAAGVVAPFLLILGFLAFGGTIWALIEAIHDRNDWMILYACFGLFPGCAIVAALWAIGYG